MDWTKVKSIFEEEEKEKKEYDWETLKSKFEPEKTKEASVKVGAGVGIGVKLGIGVEPKEELPKSFLEAAPEEKKTFFSEIKKIFEAKPIEQIAKAQVSYNISQKTGKPIEEIHKNLDKVTKELGLRGIPTSEEYLSAMFMFPVTAALISNPISAGIGVTKFMALTEAENFAISKLKKWEYKFGAGVGIKELLPEETNQLTKDLVDVAEFIGKGFIIAKTDKNLMKMWNKFTKDISTEYKMPQKMYVSAEKVKSIFGTGEKISAEEMQLIKDLGLNATQYKNAIKNGIDIEIPAEKVTTFADKPYWAKIKSLFNVKPIAETVVTKAGKVEPAKAFIEGEVKPTVTKVVPEIKPEIKPEVKPEIPTVKTKEQFYAEKYGIPVEEIKVTELPKATEEAKIISELIKKGEKLEEIPEPTKEDLELIEKGFETLSKEEFLAKVEAEIKPEEVVTPEEIRSMVEYEKDMIYQLSTGREKMRVPIATKTEWKEALGKGKYMQIFRDDKNLPTADEVASSLGISEDELREQITERIRYKPEKLISPEGLVVGEAGAMYIPSMKEVQNIGTKIASTLSIEAPFIKAGAKETGFQVKNYFSNIGLAHDQALTEINKLNKFDFKIPTVTESGFKASGELDYTDLTYLSERPGYFVNLTPEERKIASPAKQSIKDFYKRWEDKLKEIGWLQEPFPKSLISRNARRIGDLKASLPRLKTPEARATALAEIDKLTEQNDRIKKQKIQFVSVPAKAILAKVDDSPELRAKIMSILPHWGRTTITVKDLVDAKVITRQEADIRYILGEYADRMGRKFALGKIFENAEKEGLIKSAAQKPDWPTARVYIKGQYVSIPQLRGKRLDPFFNDVITDFFSKSPLQLGTLFGGVKMLQFYNPLFMPMYDVWQSAAAGTFLNPVKGAEETVKGIKDITQKTENYWIAYENGTFSKPFVIPYDKWEYQFTEAMKGNKLGEFFKKAALPTNWIPMLYTGSWHTAWKLDETVRMVTFNYLKDKGMNDREAGQLTALFHSDYASVPPQTRKILNKIFFTPTFKITMGKLYLNMLKGTANVATKGKAATTEDKILARGALLALAGMMGASLYFKSQGYEEQEKFRKYVKKVETDEGLKENVITLSNPFNIPWRYYYRLKGAFKPQTTNVAEKTLQVVKWDLHPIWRVASDVVENYNGQIYNPFDKAEDIALDILKYSTGEIVKITKGILESAEAGEIKADNLKALQKDFGKLEAIILRPFVFNYLRETKEKRRVWAINKLQDDFRYLMIVSPSKDPKVNYERLQNFNKRMQEIITEFQ